MKSAKGAPVTIGQKSQKAGSSARSSNGVGKSVGKKSMGGMAPATGKPSARIGGKWGK